MKKNSQLTRWIAKIVTMALMFGCLSTILVSCAKASITLDKTEEALFVGDSLKITANVSGEEDAEVEWSTSNQAVATVRRGTVSAVGTGTAVITASLENGATATCNISVSKRTVTISKTTASINLDESNSLTLTATASDNGQISWTSSDPTIASVTGGEVTAYDIGEVTITAQRGTAKATCIVTITEPSRPADYYTITKLTNSDVVADPGVWHYHADGSMGADYAFSSEPLHKNSTASATLSTIPDVNSARYFYFRYQPNQVELNQYYTMQLEITVSQDCTLRLGSRRSDGTTFAPLQETVQANVTKTSTYIGYRNEYEPFSVRIDSAIDAENVSISVKLVSVEANDGTNLPDYQTSVEEKPTINYTQIETDSSSYAMEIKTNSETVASPAKWYYNSGESSTINSVNYNNASIVMDFATMATSGNNQLRYRPDVAANTKIKISFSIASTAEIKTVVAACNSQNYSSHDWAEKIISENGNDTFSVEMTLAEADLIFVQITAKGEAKTNATVTISDVKIYKEAEDALPDASSYEVMSKTNDEVKANPNVWAYNASSSTIVSGTPTYNNGTLSINFSSVESGNSGDIQLRIKPDFENGINYRITFDISADKDLALACAPNGGEGWYSNTLTANDTVTMSCDFTMTNNANIFIRIRNSFTQAESLSITLTNIVITALN